MNSSADTKTSFLPDSQGVIRGADPHAAELKQQPTFVSQGFVNDQGRVEYPGITDPERPHTPAEQVAFDLGQQAVPSVIGEVPADSVTLQGGK